MDLYEYIMHMSSKMAENHLFHYLIPKMVNSIENDLIRLFLMLKLYNQHKKWMKKNTLFTGSIQIFG